MTYVLWYLAIGAAVELFAWCVDSDLKTMFTDEWRFALLSVILWPILAGCLLLDYAIELGEWLFGKGGDDV